MLNLNCLISGIKDIKPCFKQGMIFFIGGIIANVFNYFYRIIMGRMLGPELFGELVAIISLILILAVFSTSVQTAVTRYSAVYLGKESLKRIKGFFRYLTQVISFGSLGLIILTFIFAKLIQNFLKLSSINYVYFLIGIVVVMIFSGVTKGILQGLKRFSLLSFVLVAESAGKVVLAVGLVVFGFKMTGALGGFLISLILAYFLTIYFIRDILSQKTENRKQKIENRRQETRVIKEDAELNETKEIWTYIFYSFLVFLFLNILTNVDKILAKRYFSAFEAGIYSAFTTFGYAIFIAISLLAAIMFPLVVFKQAKKEDYFKELKTISLISCLIIVGSCLIFFLFPKELLFLFFGNEYLKGASFLGYYGIIMGTVGFIFLLSLFFMALKKFKFLYFLALGTVLEILLIGFWHQSFNQLISMFFVALIFTLLGLGFLIFLEIKKVDEERRMV